MAGSQSEPRKVPEDAPATWPKRGEWTWDLLEKHCKTAVKLELYTIPLYLYALYSIDPQLGATPEAKKLGRNAAGAIKQIVKEEMLHLALAGNLLCAIGGTPKLYGVGHTPQYPCQIFCDKTLDLSLGPPDLTAIETFMKLEAPHIKPEYPKGNILPDYESIGDLYTSLEFGIQEVHYAIETKKLEGPLFDTSRDNRQFTSEDFSYPGDDGEDEGMIQIKNLDDANKAMKLIKDQGEGSTKLPDDSDESESESHEEGSTTQDPDALAKSRPNSHWGRFYALYETKTEIPHHKTVKDPKTDPSNYGENIHQAMRAFDALYCYLLLSIESVWKDLEDGGQRQSLVGNISQIMSMLSMIAKFLVKQQVRGGDRAGPPFNHYEFGDEAKADVIRELGKAEKKAYPTGSFPKIAGKANDDLFDLKNLTFNGTKNEDSVDESGN